MHNIPAATASHTQWYAIELCFFFYVDVGIVVFVMTDLLSQKNIYKVYNKMILTCRPIRALPRIWSQM